MFHEDDKKISTIIRDGLLFEYLSFEEYIFSILPESLKLRSKITKVK